MTATKADPFAFWNPGPPLTSATSPQPIMPQRTVRRIDIVIVDTTPGRRVRERRRVESPGGRPPCTFLEHILPNPRKSNTYAEEEVAKAGRYRFPTRYRCR